MLEEANYSVAEVTKILKVSERTVTSWLRNRRLRGWKNGHSWRIPVTAIDEFLRSAQIDGVEPPQQESVRAALANTAQSEHASELLRHLKTLRNEIDYLTQSSLGRWSRGPSTALKLPRFNRITWRSIEQHLVATSVWDAFELWKESGRQILDAELAVANLMKALGESRFGVPLAVINPPSGGRLTWGFASAGIDLVRNYDDPDEALQSSRIQWQDNALTFDVGYMLTAGVELTEEEARRGFESVVEEVMASENAGVLREALVRHRKSTNRLEDELDGIEIAHAVPGACGWCPGKPL